MSDVYRIHLFYSSSLIVRFYIQVSVSHKRIDINSCESSIDCGPQVNFSGGNFGLKNYIKIKTRMIFPIMLPPIHEHCQVYVTSYKQYSKYYLKRLPLQKRIDDKVNK